jgi:hypothetical protein
MRKPKRAMMLYVAEVGDGLIKVGITAAGREQKRLTELRREFGPQVEIFERATIPDGWGTPQQWELRFKAKILRPRYRDQLEALDIEEGDGCIRCAGYVERVPPPYEKHSVWLDYEYADQRSVKDVPSTEVIEATRAEATIAFRELFQAAAVPDVPIQTIFVARCT